MATLTAVAQLAAALALLAIAIALGLLALRIKRLTDEVCETVRTRVNPVLDGTGRLLAGLSRGAARLEEDLTTVGRLLERADGIVSGLEPKALSRTLLTPVVASVVGWITGAKKAVSVLRQGSEKKGDA